MARESEDREDLFAEARALEPRIEWLATGSSLPIVLGLRGAALSIYYTSDLVDHFNAMSELRRAFRSGEIVKSEAGQLIGMIRHRDLGSVELTATPWTTERTSFELQQCETRLVELIAQLERGEGKILRCEPEPEGFSLHGDEESNAHSTVALRATFVRALKAIHLPIRIAQVPHAQAGV